MVMGVSSGKTISKRGSLSCHMEFGMRVQEGEESLADFATALAQLYDKCSFGSSSGFVLLRDRFLIGLKSQSLRLDLVARIASNQDGENVTTFQSLVELATRVESGSLESEGVLYPSNLAAVKFACKICHTAVFSYESDLARHQIKAHNEAGSVHPCPECPEVFATHHGLAIHTSLKHKTEERFSDKRFRNSEPVKCNLCDKMCASETGLKLHLQLAHGKTAKLRFPCGLCSRSYSLKADLRKHYRQAHSDDGELEPTLGDFKCRPCGQRFGSRRGLRLHQKKFHRSYGCEDCSEIFDSIGDLEKHQTESGHGTHSPASSGLQNQRSTGLCDICGKSFKDPAAHIANIHSETKGYHCPKCKFTHATAAGIRRHTQSSVHLGKEEVSSEGRSRKTKKKKKENPEYFCGICDKSFSSKSTADHHIRVIHLKETPYSCVSCQESFKSRKDLATHQRIVHEKKWFECEYCSKQFRQNSDLKLHVKRVHLNQCRYQCPKCSKGFKSLKPYNLHKSSCDYVLSNENI